MSNIHFEDIDNAFSEILLAIKKDAENNPIELKEDYYWAIGQGELYDVENSPKDLTIGSLHDNLKDIKCIDQNNALPVLMNKLVPLLTYLANK